ncbi:MAG: metallopeptidase TldD-related protein [Elusimicrobiota bacterium]|jgi:predicted Zn-dependent protease
MTRDIRRTPLLLLAAAALLSAPAAAALDITVAAGDPAIFGPMGDEMKRTLARLQMQKLGLPYFLAYTVRDTRRFEISASFGALKESDDSRYRRVSLDLRVGDAAFDNTHYIPKDTWHYAPVTDSLVIENDYDALRFDLWSVTDRTYKQALETLSKKRAYKNSRLIKGELPDLSKDDAVTAIEPLTEPSFDRARWEEAVRRLSAVFKAYPAVQSSQVGIYWTQEHVFFLDSQGRETQRNAHDVEISIEASAQAPDGMKLSDRRRVIRKTPAELPPYEALAAEAAGLAKDLTALAAAPLWEETYTGPVLFEGQAAGEFFDQLLARNISFPRSLWLEEEERMKEYFHSGAFSSRLGLRVVAPSLSVFDDPGVASFEGTPLIGHYKTDDQGMRARKVELIKAGILKDLLMSREPVKERSASNGHGRGGSGEVPTARIGSLFIESEKTADAERLKEELIRQAKAFGLDHGLIIRRMAGEHFRGDAEALAAPKLVYKVSVKNGKEELYRNSQFMNVTPRALRDIALAGKSRRVHNYYQLGPYRFSRGEVPASIVHPDILVAEMELKKTEEKPEKPPLLEHPFFSKK